MVVPLLIGDLNSVNGLLLYGLLLVWKGNLCRRLRVSFASMMVLRWMYNVDFHTMAAPHFRHWTDTCTDIFRNVTQVVRSFVTVLAGTQRGCQYIHVYHIPLVDIFYFLIGHGSL